MQRWLKTTWKRYFNSIKVHYNFLCTVSFGSNIILAETFLLFGFYFHVDKLFLGKNQNLLFYFMLKPMKHLFGKSLIISGKYKKFETPIVLEKIEKILQFLFVRFNLFALSFIILVCTKKAYQHKYIRCIYRKRNKSNLCPYYWIPTYTYVDYQIFHWHVSNSLWHARKFCNEHSTFA